MFILQVFVGVLGLCVSTAYNHFTLTNCGSSSNPLLTLTAGFRVYPVQLPGEIWPYCTVRLHRPVQGHLRADVTVEKWIVFDYFSLPCLSRVGSCSYDVCELLNWFEERGCPRQLSASNMPCMCPFTNGTYTLGLYSFYVPELKFSWRWIASGDFRVTVRLVDTVTQTEVTCYSSEFAVTQGWFNSWWSG